MDALGARKYCSSVLGGVTHIEQCEGGLVHWVYRATLQDGSVVYVKVRGKKFRLLPGILTDPDDMRIEVAAIDYFNAYRDKNVVVPRVLNYDRSRGIMILTSVGMAHLRLLEQLNATGFDVSLLPTIASRIAAWIGCDAPPADLGSAFEAALHRNFAANLQYRVNRHNVSSIQWLAKRLAAMDKTIIHGDISPKNLFIEGGQLGICDFENCQIGPRVLDVGYCIAHLILHVMNTPGMPQVLRDIAAVLDLTADERAVVWPVVASVMLYRIDNERIPYALPIRPECRARLMARLYKYIGQGQMSGYGSFTALMRVFDENNSVSGVMVAAEKYPVVIDPVATCNKGFAMVAENEVIMYYVHRETGMLVEYNSRDEIVAVPNVKWAGDILR